MRIEPDQLWSYFEWLFTNFGLLKGVLVATALFVLGFVVCFLISMARVGPVEGFYQVTRVIYELIARDIPNTSIKRVYALARLAFQEAIRRKVLAVFAVFVVVLLFAGWFLDPTASNVARLYIVFVMFGASLLMMMLGLFLSCFSLPNDIKNKTVQTIVTKPVRPTEILLGRVVGFTTVGTIMLTAMWLLSWVFVERGVKHAHSVETVAADGLSGTTSYDAGHSHTFRMKADKDGNPTIGATSEANGHTHTVIARKSGDGYVYEIGEPEGLLLARKPVFGSMSMTDRSGTVTERGLNVGYESDYHTYIEGASLMSARWKFTGLKEADFPGDILPIEMSLQAFRTVKGDIVTGVQGAMILRNPNGKAESTRIPFIVKEFAIDRKEISKDLNGSDENGPRELNIFEDLVDENGDLEIIIRCEDRGQYFGMAPPDVYLRQGDSAFGWNLFKGYLGIWMQMVLVICLGVMFSTFLSGPVAMIATITCLVLGYFGDVAIGIATGEIVGGGPIESIIRMPLQSGSMVELDLGSRTLELVVQKIDQGIMYTLAALFQAIPSFGQFNTSNFVAYGFNIFPGLVSRHLTMTLAYFVLTMAIAYFFMKTKEVAAA